MKLKHCGSRKIMSNTMWIRLTRIEAFGSHFYTECCGFVFSQCEVKNQTDFGAACSPEGKRTL
jgi:hypothetical protein